MKKKLFFADILYMRTKKEQFSERLERLLKNKNMQKKELADKCGISSNGISTWKVTGSYPRADIAVKIAKVLGVSVEYLVTGKLPNIEYNDGLAYTVSRLPEKKRKFIKTMIESLSVLD